MKEIKRKVYLNKKNNQLGIYISRKQLPINLRYSNKLNVRLKILSEEDE
jgi:hypothetical protein